MARPLPDNFLVDPELSRVCWRGTRFGQPNSHEFESACQEYEVGYAVSVPAGDKTHGLILYLASSCGENLCATDGHLKLEHGELVARSTIISITWRKFAKGSGRWRQCAPPEVHHLTTLFLRSFAQMPCTLMGFSRGASEILRFAALYPAPFKDQPRLHVVLVAPYFPPSMSDRTEQKKACATLRTLSSTIDVVIGGADDFKKTSLECVSAMEHQKVDLLLTVPPRASHESAMKKLCELRLGFY